MSEQKNVSPHMVPSDRTVFTGDIVFANAHPIMWAGPIENWVRACDVILGMELDTVVPGHGPLGSKAMIRDYRQMLVDARERIGKLKAAGKSENEVVAAKPNADYDAKYKVDERAIGNFIRVVYRSLKG